MSGKTEKLKLKEGRDLFVKTSSTISRAVFSFFMPGGLIILVAFLLTRAPIVEATPGLARVYPWIILIVGLFFGWRLNRSQLIFVIIVLVVVDRSLLQFFSDGAGPEGVRQTVYNAVSFLLPLNLVVFSMMKEHGILSLDGLMRLSLIPMQIFGIALVCTYPDMGFAVYLKHAFFNWPMLEKIPMAQPALIAFVFAAFLLLIRYAQDRGAIECGFFWLLVSCFLALNSGDIGPASTIFFSTGGLVLITAVIETTYGRAYRDELTGLPGRRALSETLAKLGSRFTVAMVDIDRFKKFNDNFGHHVGDQVLRMIASKLENATGGGRAFRYGGEEFVMIFPGKQLDETFAHLEKLRKDIADSGFFLRGSDRRFEKPKGTQKGKTPKGRKKVTVSIGVAERNERDKTSHQVVKAADQALYRAKNKGRNKVSR